MGQEPFTTATEADFIRAIAADDVDMIQRHLDAGFSITTYFSDGLQALHHALTYQAYGVVDLLLAAGADPNGPTEHGAKPLPIVGEVGDAQLYQTLINAGADPNTVADGADTKVWSFVGGHTEWTPYLPAAPDSPTKIFSAANGAPEGVEVGVSHTPLQLFQTFAWPLFLAIACVVVSPQLGTWPPAGTVAFWVLVAGALLWAGLAYYLSDIGARVVVTGEGVLYKTVRKAIVLPWEAIVYVTPQDETEWRLRLHYVEESTRVEIDGMKAKGAKSIVLPYSDAPIVLLKIVVRTALAKDILVHPDLF